MVKKTRPSPLSRTLALVPPTVLLVAQHANAAFNTFIKIGDIKGDSTDSKHAEWINLDSMQWGIGRGISSPTGGSANREASAPSISEITLTKKLDKSTPYLFLNAVGGSTSFATVTIEMTNPSTSGVFYRITLSDVLISGVSTSASSGSDIPTESVSLNFTKIKMEYYATDAKTGALTLVSGPGYDLATQKSF